MGFARIIVFPFFLFTGILEKRIRHETEEFAAEHPETELLSAGYLDAHPLLLDAFLERAEEAIYGSPNMNCELCKYRVPAARLRAGRRPAAVRPPPSCAGYRPRRCPTLLSTASTAINTLYDR